ncbi:hypothetical protein V7134_29765 [Priestia megaterium]
MSEHKNIFSTFVNENQFDLHSYLTYLFINDLIQLEDEHIT